MFHHGDSRFFEESINAGKLKDLLDGRSHTAQSGIQERIKAMKWLLAMISKGRDVSQFYPDVVKNVIVKSVELKKLVYVYLIHYTDHDANSRDLALLSINSFQKDLADRSPLIRALALRTMTSIRVRDIGQLQLMAVQKCTLDGSAFVRKTACLALPKIYRIDQSHKDDLIELLKKLLGDTSTMVLGSAMVAYQEICPEHFEIIHPIFRRLCSTVADVDEWGQIVIITVLTRYAREFFCKPKIESGVDENPPTTAPAASSSAAVPPVQRKTHDLYQQYQTQPEHVRKLPTKKELQSFYSDDSDKEDSAEQQQVVSVASSSSGSSVVEDEDIPKTTEEPLNETTMEEDHRLLLKSCLPLLRSRNSGVVLSVVSIMWYCGRRSPVAMEKLAGALARMLRSHREVQYIALNAIVPLASEMPQYFRPHLKQFFVNGSVDAAFVRQVKVDVLTLLVNADNVEQMLSEFEVYLAHPDKLFVCCVIRAVGRLVNELPFISVRCLRGLVTLMTSEHEQVVAEAVVVTRTILQQHPDNPSMVRWLVKMFDLAALPSARASLIWIASEFIECVSDLAPELLRKLVINFEEEESEVKIQVINLGVRLYLVNDTAHERAREVLKLLLDYTLELARFDLDYDLRDRVRMISTLLMSNGKYDKKRILLSSKPPPSVQRIESRVVVDPHCRFSFDSLSHIVGHAAFGYQPLVDWPTLKANPSLRDPAYASRSVSALSSRGSNAFYAADDDDSSSTSSASSSSSSSSSGSSSGHSDSGSESGSESDSSSSSSSTGSSTSSLHATPKSKKSDDVLALFDSYGADEKRKSSSSSKKSGNMVDLLMEQPNNAPSFMPLLNSVHGDGLQVECAFTRELSNCSPEMSFLKLKITNKRNTMLTDIRLTSIKDDKKIVPFPEIGNLGVGESITVDLHVNFCGQAKVKFSFATDRGFFPVVLEIPSGESLLPDFEMLTKFEEKAKQLVGMHEAVKKWTPSEQDKLSKFTMEEKMKRIRTVANVAGQIEGDDIKCVGRKIEDDKVFVLIRLHGNEVLRIGSDDVLLGSVLLDIVAKRLLLLAE